MLRFDFNRTLQIALTLLTVTLLTVVAAAYRERTKTVHLTLAAGSSSGESYVLSTALKHVVERHNPRITITVRETAGTAENIRALQEGKADLATAQADVPPGSAGRMIAILYDDAFQCLSRSASVRSFPDLSGKRVALPRGGGQFESFLRVASHFGLRETDFEFVGVNDAAAESAFLEGRADAIFRVRALGNPAIQRLVRWGSVHFLGIEHAAAMKIRHPAFEPAIIPAGAYLGNPPVPEHDVPAVSVHRTLLANSRTDEAAVRAVTETLIERRGELIQEIPPDMVATQLLVAQIRRPDAQTGLGVAIHPGARSYYDKDKPSFFLAHADYVGLMITVALMLGSWVWQLKSWIEHRQKSNADQYSNRVIQLMIAAQNAESPDVLTHTWTELLAVLTSAVRDLDADKLSEESFQTVRAILQIALEVAREKRASLLSVAH